MSPGFRVLFGQETLPASCGTSLSSKGKFPVSEQVPKVQYPAIAVLRKIIYTKGLGASIRAK
jgi:hypothetical protein